MAPKESFLSAFVSLAGSVPLVHPSPQTLALTVPQPTMAFPLLPAMALPVTIAGEPVPVLALETLAGSHVL